MANLLQKRMIYLYVTWIEIIQFITITLRFGALSHKRYKYHMYYVHWLLKPELIAKSFLDNTFQIRPISNYDRKYQNAGSILWGGSRLCSL
jgi:hypothetical protein